jgi:hypothetical protein
MQKLYAAYIKLYPTEKRLNMKKHKESLNFWEFKLISDVPNRIRAELRPAFNYI